MTDLSNWDFAKTFSGTEAASLILGIDPASAEQHHGVLFPIIERMKEDFDGALSAAVWAYEFNDSAKGQLPDQLEAPKHLYSHRMFHLTGYETNADRLREGHWLKNEEETKFDKQQFSREEMVRWINANRMSSVYKFGVENGGRVGRWPWGDHHTELLGHLEAAGIRFWGASYYDPTDKGTAPKNEDIESWLEKERGLESNSMRKAIATILRLNGLPKGPRTK